MMADDMRTQLQNPAYERFRHLLPPSGLYPARWVDIFSNTTEDYQYNDVEVVFIPRGAVGITFDDDFWDAFADYNGRWLGNLGNSVADWMEPGGLNPDKVFGGMLAHGFSSKQTLADTIGEFASIEECEWARLMHTGKFKEVLAAFGRGREKAISVLQDQICYPWARDILDALRSEAIF